MIKGSLVEGTLRLPITATMKLMVCSSQAWILVTEPLLDTGMG